MITDAVLEQGVVRGIVTNEQVASLRTLARDMAAAAAPEPEDDEKLRFITGFSDIFVTLGLALFSTAIGYFTEKAAGSMVMWGVLALTAWLLAEFFTRRRRMALPSIALLVLFAVSIFGVVDNALSVLPGFVTDYDPQATVLGIDPNRTGIVAAAALATVLMTALHYLRFRVPITIAAGTGALALAVLGLLLTFAPELTRAYMNILVLILGAATFALAMRFDFSDPARVTRRTDIAFWLHLLAAPMIVHPLISRFVMQDTMPQVWMAVAVLAIFVVLGAIAVVIDRRAMLVSGLTYAGYAFASLITRVGFSDQALPATLLALGAFVLLLSAGWRPVRTALLRLLPAHLAQRLPHPILSSS